MCGIVGMAGDLNIADRQVFRDMLDVCQTRGRDSTGVININKQKSYGYFKSLGPPTYMFDRKGYTDTIESGSHAALVGHCRHKTSGAVSVANAHPFEFEDEGIIGVHNGTLRNYHRLDGHTYNKVDSEVLYGHLAKHGPEETFNKIDGAWACVWWNDKEETLNFFRNEERTLYFCWSADRRKMYWASSIWMFHAIEVERRVKMWNGPKDDGQGKYIALPPHMLWSFTLEPNAKTGDPTLKMKPAKKIEPKPPTTYGYYRQEDVGNGGTSSASYKASSEPTALDVWRKKSTLTHTWDVKSGTHIEKMPYQEWQKKFYAEKLEKQKSGGEVPNPFSSLDDQLPVHLRPKKETLSLIQGGKSSTTDSTPSSSSPSKSGSEQETQSNSTTNGDKTTNSQDPETSTNSQKTSKSDSTAVPFVRQTNNGGFLSNALVSFRSVAARPFITDEKTGDEYSEEDIQENTGGICSYCDEPIGDLTEIYEFYDKNKFICTHCTEPSVRSSAA